MNILKMGYNTVYKGCSALALPSWACLMRKVRIVRHGHAYRSLGRAMNVKVALKQVM